MANREMNIIAMTALNCHWLKEYKKQQQIVKNFELFNTHQCLIPSENRNSIGTG
jgi:hypothetical protein